MPHWPLILKKFRGHIVIGLSSFPVCYSCKHVVNIVLITIILFENKKGAQWLSGRVLDSRPKG